MRSFFNNIYLVLNTTFSFWTTAHGIRTPNFPCSMSVLRANIVFLIEEHQLLILHAAVLIFSYLENSYSWYYYFILIFILYCLFLFKFLISRGTRIA